MHIDMQPDVNPLLEIVGITIPVVGFYDAPDTQPFEPLAETGHCFFSCFSNWAAGYWLCGVESLPRDRFVDFLAHMEGLKSSPEIMDRWLNNQHPYKMEHANIVIGSLKADQYSHLKTITFFVNPDQLSLSNSHYGFSNQK